MSSKTDELYGREIEKNIRLEKALKALLEADNTTQVLIRIFEPFSDAEGYTIAGKPWHEWYEERIFNEERLYKALDKDDARSVLGIWRRFIEVSELLRQANTPAKKTRKVKIEDIFKRIERKHPIIHKEDGSLTKAWLRFKERTMKGE